MTTQNMKDFHKQNSGFTIVELLIVIVIIGILAALVIVAYTGIQARARTAQYQTDALAVVKKMEAYNASAGVYPVTGSTTTGTAGASAVTTLMSTVKESTLPQSASIYSVNAPNTAPTYAQAVSAAPVNDVYYVSYCSTGGGVNIYYPDTTNSIVKTLTAGTCP